MTPSFQTVATRWKAEKRQWVKPSSYATYVWLLNSYLLPFFSARDSFGEADVQAFVNGQLARGIAPKTIRDTLVVLKMILRFGRKECGWPNMEFTVHFPTWAEEKPPVPVLRETDQKRLLRHLRANCSYRNLGILICLQSGLRIGELCALQWKDLDTRSGIIRITKTIQRICLSDGAEKDYRLVVGTPKTTSSVREIPMSGELKRLIQQAKKDTLPGHYVLSNSTRPLEPRTCRTYFRRLLKQLGIPSVRFHALRHTFASRCIQSRCDYKTVSAILGHSSLATTMDLYVHPGLQDKRRCVERLVKSWNTKRPKTTS